MRHPDDYSPEEVAAAQQTIDRESSPVVGASYSQLAAAYPAYEASRQAAHARYRATV